MLKTTRAIGSAAFGSSNLLRAGTVSAGGWPRVRAGLLSTILSLAMNASRYFLFLFLCVLATGLTGCDAIAGIFKGGFYVGIIVTFLVVALLFFLVNKMRGRS